MKIGTLLITCLKAFSILMTARIEGTISAQDLCNLKVVYRVADQERTCLRISFTPSTGKIRLACRMDI